jgi:hypothetical protein
MERGARSRNATPHDLGPNRDYADDLVLPNRKERGNTRKSYRLKTHDPDEAPTPDAHEDISTTQELVAIGQPRVQWRAMHHGIYGIVGIRGNGDRVSC